MNNQIVTSPLTNPSALPLVSIESIALSPVLVVAPHPDDETLGCGGAIALLNSLNCDVYVLVVSDGTRSHPHSLKYPASKLQKLRESETLTALNLLGLDAKNVTFLGLQDGSVLTEYRSAINSCCSYLTQINPQIIFLPWRYDPHRDHRGSWELVNTALSSLSLNPKIIEYPIWDWDEQQRGNVIESEKIRCWRLNISTVVEMKQQAISAYRSQITDLIDDDPEGFRLTPDMLANFVSPWEVYMEFSKN
jgi:LmbE family N-acetylglucosaminyl deacetylase